jgi:hypothetical protein
MNLPKILVAHSPDEQHYAEKISSYLEIHGFESSHRGTVLVGDSIIAEASKLLEVNSPVVLCGTVRAMGTGWARRIVQAAQQRNCRVYPLQIEKDAYLSDLSLDTQILCFWQDEQSALSQLVAALQIHFPVPQTNSNHFSHHLKEFEEQKQRVESAIKKNRGRYNYG